VQELWTSLNMLYSEETLLLYCSDERTTLYNAFREQWVQV